MVRGSLCFVRFPLKEKMFWTNFLEKKIQDVSQQLNRSVEDAKKWLDGKGMMDQLKDEILTDQVYDF